MALNDGLRMRRRPFGNFNFDNTSPKDELVFLVPLVTRETLYPVTFACLNSSPKARYSCTLVSRKDHR